MTCFITSDPRRGISFKEAGKAPIDLRRESLLHKILIEFGPSRNCTISGVEIDPKYGPLMDVAYVTTQGQGYFAIPDASLQRPPSGDCRMPVGRQVSAICATLGYRIGILSPSVTRPRSRVSSLSTEIGYVLVTLARPGTGTFSCLFVSALFGVGHNLTHAHTYTSCVFTLSNCLIFLSGLGRLCRTTLNFVKFRPSPLARK